MKLNNKKSIMRANEGKPNIEKSVGYAVYVYYAILLTLLLYVGSYFVSKFITIKANGIVQANSITIQTPYNGVVTDVNFTKNIKPHQLLCNIKESIKIQNNTSSLPNQTLLINLKMKLSSAKINYILAKKQYKIDLSKFNRRKKAQILGLIDIKDDIFQNLKIVLKEDKINIMNYKLQIQNYKILLNQVENSYKKTSNNINIKYIKHPIYSPINGYLSQQNIFNGSVVKSGDVLAIIQNFDKIEIAATFDIKEINEIIPNSIFKIILPNGIEKKGYIQSSIPSNHFIKATIIPLDKNMSFWKKYNLANVKIKKVSLW